MINKLLIVIKSLIVSCLLMIVFLNSTYALSIEEVGIRVFNSALINISPIESKVGRPSADIIFMNFKINSDVYSECRGTPEQLMNYYNELGKQGIFSNIEFSSNETLQYKARSNIVGLMVCLDASSKFSIFQPSEPFEKIKVQILKITHTPTSFGPIQSREKLFREITWRILLNHYLNGDDFSATMLMSMMQLHMNNDVYSLDKAWISKIYSDLVLNYMEINNNTRGSSRAIIAMNVAEAIKNNLKEEEFDKAKKILFLDEKLKYLDDDNRAGLKEKLYFKEKFKTDNHIKLNAKKTFLALARMDLTGKLFILFFLYLTGLGIKIKQNKRFYNIKAREKIEIILHPFSYYLLENQGPVYKIIHTILIFYTFSIFTDYIKIIESEISKNIYWFGF